MRFKVKRYEPGEYRVVRKFLLIPAEGETEIRWLEYANIKQCYGGYELGWMDIEFIDEEPNGN